MSTGCNQYVVGWLDHRASLLSLEHLLPFHFLGQKTFLCQTRETNITDNVTVGLLLLRVGGHSHIHIHIHSALGKQHHEEEVDARGQTICMSCKEPTRAQQKAPAGTFLLPDCMPPLTDGNERRSCSSRSDTYQTRTNKKPQYCLRLAVLRLCRLG